MATVVRDLLAFGDAYVRCMWSCDQLSHTSCIRLGDTVVYCRVVMDV